MNHFLVSVFSFSVFVPAIVALIFFRKIDKSYFPFLYSLWLGSLNEILSYVLMNRQMHTTLNNNIYVLIESVVLAWYFLNKDIITRSNFFFILLFLCIVWTGENFIFKSIYLNSTYFRIVYSMVIAVLSIQLVNRIFYEYKRDLYSNPDFILCCCFIIYFTYKALIQSFVIYGSTKDYVFLRKIYDILLYINLGVNLLYTLAVIWMPRKARFMSVSLSQ
jgi:hypothetical protein